MTLTPDLRRALARSLRSTGSLSTPATTREPVSSSKPEPASSSGKKRGSRFVGVELPPPTPKAIVARRWIEKRQKQKQQQDRGSDEGSDREKESEDIDEDVIEVQSPRKTRSKLRTSARWSGVGSAGSRLKITLRVRVPSDEEDGGDDEAESEVASGDGEESESDEGMDTEDFIDDGPGTRSSRRKAKQNKKNHIVEPTRRSSRQGRNTKPINFAEEGEWEEGDSMDVDRDDDGKDEVIARRTRRAKRNVIQDDDNEEHDVAAKITISADAADGNDTGAPDVKAHFRHRPTCHKCEKAPASLALRPLLERKEKILKTKKGQVGVRMQREEEELRDLGSWVECGSCAVALHFDCLPKMVQAEVSRLVRKAEAAANAANARVSSDDANDQDGEEKSNPEEEVDMLEPEQAPENGKKAVKKAKKELDPLQTITLPMCFMCSKEGGRKCFVCKKVEKEVTEANILEKEAQKPSDDSANEVGTLEQTAPEDTESQGLLFRCAKCQRASHYGCLPSEDYDVYTEGDTAEDKAPYYHQDWACHECDHWKEKVDAILAWRPITEGKTLSQEDLEKVPLPDKADPFAQAEYCVKWKGKSYRHLEWLPHAFLLAYDAPRLRGFLKKGSKVDTTLSSAEKTPDLDDTLDGPTFVPAPEFKILPDPDIEKRLPTDWMTIDRILDAVVEIKGTEMSIDDVPEKKFTDDPKAVTSCYIKWRGLNYADSTWDEPPEEDDEMYPVFEAAYAAFLRARHTTIPVLKSDAIKQIEKSDLNRDPANFKALKEQPDYLRGGNLMDFQLEGVNWLYFNWWKNLSGILADEMGLGKTVQIVTFVSLLFKKENRLPFLIVVPNATIGNWVREFEKWAPEDLRVVPFNGAADSREIIEKYELFHPDSAGKRLKTHVVLATYESLASEAALFRRIPRWELLVVDEGQRLKAGESGKLFREINTLRVGHKILLSGTPLNNNLTELFNLLNFLDPLKWPEPKVLQEEYENLTGEMISKLRKDLKPYFLRRTKETVLELPPLNEIIVPVSLRPLQKKICKSILSKNIEDIHSLFQKTSGGRKSASKRTNFTNILTELRKCIQHPYLVASDIEPMEVSEEEQHLNLIDASTKLVLLKQMIPKLRARGHRILIFSQFKIVLNILESFFQGEGVRYTRIDGGTPQLDKQKRIDAFNDPASQLEVFILTTRSGGVGINLTTASAVIVFDSDFNPHQDLQAIARAHRIGQKRTVCVFKLVAKGTAEEKIIQAGKRKLVLDHLIVQSLQAEADDAQDVESILQFGAKDLFEQGEGESESDIKYNDADIDKLLNRVETADVRSPARAGTKTFAFARIWERTDCSLREVSDETEKLADAEDQRSFWNNILQAQRDADREAKAAAEAQMGRGHRQRVQVLRPQQFDDPDLDLTPEENKKAKKRMHSDADISGDEFVAELSGAESASDDEGMGSGPEYDIGDHDILSQGGALQPIPPLSKDARRAAKKKQKVKRTEMVYDDSVRNDGLPDMLLSDLLSPSQMLSPFPSPSSSTSKPRNDLQGISLPRSPPPNHPSGQGSIYAANNVVLERPGAIPAEARSPLQFGKPKPSFFKRKESLVPKPKAGTSGANQRPLPGPSQVQHQNPVERVEDDGGQLPTEDPADQERRLEQLRRLRRKASEFGNEKLDKIIAKAFRKKGNDQVKMIMKAAKLVNHLREEQKSPKKSPREPASNMLARSGNILLATHPSSKRAGSSSLQLTYP